MAMMEYGGVGWLVVVVVVVVGGQRLGPVVSCCWLVVVIAGVGSRSLVVVMGRGERTRVGGGDEG